MVNGTGFSAHALEDEVFDDGETITFPETKYNRGNHYDVQTSSFTVPYTGTYLFTINIVNVYESWMGAYLVRNTEDVIYLIGDPLGTFMSTNSVVLQCQAGDVMYVRSSRDGCAVRAYDAATTFSGVLLHISA